MSLFYSVNTNVSALATRQYLAEVRETAAAIQKRASTGLRVADAVDDGATFSISREGRGTIAAWAAVRERQIMGRALVDQALVGARAISDEIAGLRADVITYNGPLDAEQKRQLRTQIERRVAQIDTFTREAEFNGLRPLTGTAGSVPVATGSSGGAGVTVNTHTVGPGAIAIRVEYDAYGVPDQFELLFNGAVVADTGAAVSGTGTLNFAYPGGPPDDIQVRVTGPTGTAWTYQVFAGVAQPARTIDVPLNPSGDTIAIEYRPLTSDQIQLSPLVLTPADVALQRIEAALTAAGNALNYYGGMARRLDGMLDFANVLGDEHTEAVGAIVDADMAKESARLAAIQVQEQLATQSLGVANQSPQLLLRLFG